jgi:F0F1-type ATP synthase membrane subunit c/vacuolar-type H+-ATPase subunit K
MDWVLLVVLGIVLPSTGGVIGAMMVFNKYTYLKAKSHEMDMDEAEFRKKYFGKHMAFQNQFVTGSIFGMIILIIFWISTTEIDAPYEMLSNIGIACTMMVGGSAFFSNISRGLIVRKGVEAVVKDPMNFGRVIVHSAMVDTCMIFGLLLAILSLLETGLFDNEPTVTLSQSKEILNAAIIFSCTSSGILLSGALLNRVKEPFNMSSFGKGIVMNTVGTVPPLIGLLYVIIKFSQMGILTG